MHIPVLLNEVIKYLNPRPNENFIDCTIGEAGHSLAILEKIKPEGKILGIDADINSLRRIKAQERLFLVQGNFKNLKKIVEEHKFYPICGVLFDLGLSSWQIDESRRGFSFKKDEPLDMRFNPEQQALTAKEIINSLPEEELREIFIKYGEEKYSGRIAKKIIKERRGRKIETARKLKEIIEKTVPLGRSYRGKIDRVLARIFQALRIAVNDELDNLKQGLEQAVEASGPGSRIVVISFHSLEDRIVKNFFKDNKEIFKILTKKPIIASKEEVENNPRSRSAKLRAAIKF